MRVFNGVIVATALAMVLAGPGAAAESVASTCTSGSAWAAGPQQPHAADPAGDATLPADGVDMRAVWIGVSPGTKGEPVYTANMQVEDLAAAHAGASYDIRVLDTNLSAVLGPDGSWSFAATDVILLVAGVPAGQVAYRSLQGEVDLDQNRISITIPSDVAPSGPGAVTSRVSASTGLRVSGWQGSANHSLLMLLDGWAEHRCEAVFDGLPPA